VETVLSSATHPLLPGLCGLRFWACELDGFLLDLFVAGVWVSPPSWSHAPSEMRIVEEV
jgi:hypothetical protein